MHVVPQTWSHLHMLVSVFPTFGLLIVLGFYLGSLRSKNEGIKRACLFVIGMLGLSSAVVYFSGEGSLAQLASAKLPKDAVATHYNYGLAALALLALAGLSAWIELARTWGPGRAFSVRGSVTFALALLALVATAVAGEFGFAIHHTELQSTVVIPDVWTPPLWPHVHIILNHL